MLKILANFCVIFGIFGGVYAENLRIINWLPPQHAISIAINNWADNITKLSGNRLVFSYPRPTKLPQIMAESFIDGDIVIYYGGYDANSIGASILELMPSKQGSEKLSQNAWQIYQEYFLNLDGFNDMKILGMGASGENYLSLRQNISDISQLKNLRIIYNSEHSAKILQNLGAIAVPILGGAKLVDAVKAGIIDGVYLPIDLRETLNINKDLPYITKLNNGLSNNIFFIVMKNDVLQKLPPDLAQLVLNSSGLALSQNIGQNWDRLNQAALQHATDNGAKILPLNNLNDVIWQEQSQKILGSYLKKIPAKDISKIYQKFGN